MELLIGHIKRDKRISIDDSKLPFRFAIFKNNSKLLQLLLDHCEHPVDLYKLNESFLQSQEHPAIVRVLIHHAVVIQSVRATGRTLLGFVSQLGNLEAVRQLLDEGTDPSKVDIAGFTPLHWALTAGPTAVVRILLERGADANRQDTHGRTPLHIAIVAERADMISLLLSKNNDPNVLTKFSENALHLACRRHELTMIPYLLAVGGQQTSRQRAQLEAHRLQSQLKGEA